MKARPERVDVDLDTINEYVNEQNEILRCVRCKKRISHMGKFFVWRKLILGPECIQTAMQVGKGVHIRKLEEVIRKQFLEQKRKDTIAGMIKKGFLPPDFEG